MSDADPYLDPVQAEFDAEFYLTQNPDVAAAGLDPWAHYNAGGWREGRSPNVWFVIADYLAANPDVAVTAAEPFAHYIHYGRAEGRPIGHAGTEEIATQPGEDLSSVEAEFDADFYVTVNPALGLTPARAWAHYLKTGWADRLDPTRWFSTRHYLDTNPDVVASGFNPFVHYVLHGRREGRDLKQDLGFRYDLLTKAEGFERHVHALATQVPDREASPEGDLTALLTAAPASGRVHVTISHDDYTQSLGGVQLCVRIEGEAMRAAGAVHIHLFAGRSAPVVDLEREAPRMGVLVDGTPAGFFDASVIASALEAFCKDRRTSLVIHSVIAHRVSDVAEIATRIRPEQTFYWLHDFSSLCSNYNLMRNDVTFCGVPAPESMACEICVYGSRRQVQLAAHVDLFDAVDPVIVAPSESALGLWRSRFPQNRRGVVHPHAVFAPDKRRRAKAADQAPQRPLRVGFLGMPTSHKGWPVFAQLVRRFVGDPRYSFHHLAKSTEPGVAAALTVVAPSEANAVPMIDAVHDLELDVALIWSLWPETFCFAAFEAVAGGAAIVTCPDSGNVQDMVQRLGCGLVLADDEALHDLFISGDIAQLARSNRRVKPQSLTYSRMTADLILGDAA